MLCRVYIIIVYDFGRLQEHPVAAALLLGKICVLDYQGGPASEVFGMPK